jgi:hypothetical protein
MKWNETRIHSIIWIFYKILLSYCLEIINLLITSFLKKINLSKIKEIHKHLHPHRHHQTLDINMLTLNTKLFTNIYWI